MSDDDTGEQPDEERIREIVREELNRGPSVSRRSALAGLTAAGGLGGLLGVASQRARAAPSWGSATGKVGTSSKPLNEVIAQTATIQSLSLGGRTIANIIEGESSGLRIQHGTVSHADPGKASDGTINTSKEHRQSVTFSSAFSSTPIVIVGIGTETGSGSTLQAANISPSGFDSIQKQYRSDVSSGYNGQWLAIGPE